MWSHARSNWNRAGLCRLSQWRCRPGRAARSRRARRAYAHCGDRHVCDCCAGHLPDSGCRCVGRRRAPCDVYVVERVDKDSRELPRGNAYTWRTPGICDWGTSRTRGNVPALQAYQAIGVLGNGCPRNGSVLWNRQASAWLADIHSVGLLSSRYVPSAGIRFRRSG